VAIQKGHEIKITLNGHGRLLQVLEFCLMDPNFSKYCPDAHKKAVEAVLAAGGTDYSANKDEKS
jgi:hypothetical protein